jgi:hypothetical protein
MASTAGYPHAVIPPEELFDWYPLTGMIWAILEEELPDTGSFDPIHDFRILDRELVALCESRIPGEPPVRMPIHPRVVLEMQDGDPSQPMITIHRDDPDNWGRIQREINTAAERVAARCTP